jgi:heptosyltransferase-3
MESGLSPFYNQVIHLRRLLIRPGAIGDFILSLPALESLQSDFTELWCAEQNVPLARFADSARSIISAGLDRLGILPADDVVARLRAFDSIISWYGAARPDFRELVRTLGLPFHFFPALPDDGPIHATDFYNAQARTLGAQPARIPRILCPPLPRTFAVIHPFASSPAKRAPFPIFQANFRELSRHMPVHWLCGPEEHLPGAIRFDDLYDLAGWLRGARLFIGNDSGISHLAAAVGTPVHVYFTSTDPRLWAPRSPSVNVIRL